MSLLEQAVIQDVDIKVSRWVGFNQAEAASFSFFKCVIITCYDTLMYRKKKNSGCMLHT